MLKKTDVPPELFEWLSELAAKERRTRAGQILTILEAEKTRHDMIRRNLPRPETRTTRAGYGTAGPSDMGGKS